MGAKSPNKHNRIYLTAEPMSDELCQAIEDGKAGPKAEMKERAKFMREKFDWDENAARKIWCWGPETEGANLVVDQTQAVQYLIEIKEHVNSAFQWTAKEGPLCEENMRGIRFNLMDVTLHADSVHRGAGQIMPPTRRCCFAAEMVSQPTLQEPMFLVEITCPQDAMSGMYACSLVVVRCSRRILVRELPCGRSRHTFLLLSLSVSSRHCANRPVDKHSLSVSLTTGRTCRAMPWKLV